MAALDTFPTQDAGGLSIGDTRLINAGQLVKDTAGLPRLGVFPAHANPIVTGTAATSPMTYSIASFIGAASRTGVGAEIGGNDAAVTVSTTAAPGSNSRIDVIWWRPQFTSSSDPGNLPLFGVTQGTALLSPTKPSIPAGALELATAVILSTTVATNSGVVFTQTHPYTAAAGGVVWLRNATEQAAWSPAAGGLAWRMDTQQLIQYMPAATVPGWFPVGGKPSFDVVTFAGIYSAGTPTPRLVLAGGRYSLDGLATSSSANFVAGTSYTLGSIPAAKAPATAQKWALTANATAVASLTIDASGTVTFVLNTTFTGALQLSLSGATWPDKAL